MLNYNKIIEYYYAGQEELREILLIHSRRVAERAVKICDAHPEFNLDRNFIYTAAMLHDIGIIRCDADGIKCFGTEPYICHGTIGAQMLRSKVWNISASGSDPDVSENLENEEVERIARVCERHTGTGLTLRQIEERGLPLPHMDLVPETLEEQIICYADKFYSKTHPEREKSFEQAERSLAKFGEEGLIKFRLWRQRFEG